MDIVSYRGPGKAGGVSVALELVFRSEKSGAAKWWHLEDESLAVRDASGSSVVSRLPHETVAGHYRYCNEFLWPVMHDLPQYAIFRADDRRFYQQLNLALAEQLEQSASTKMTRFFIQDYQLSLVSSMMAGADNISSQIFWHIPWPASVLDIHRPPILEVARGLLSAEAVGFHTREYAINFLRFIEEFLPACKVDYKALTVSGSDGLGWERPSAHYPRTELPAYVPNGQMQIVVAPLGLDIEYWVDLAQANNDIFADPRFASLSGKPYVLSVDRADYTKGVLERIQAIGQFFDAEPDSAGNVTFVQLCGRTRPGMAIFDAYWQKCREAAQELQEKWGTSFWKPLIWVDSPVSSEGLAALYRHATVMLVNPVRDGLNLTAKEFVVCQQENSAGVLALSPGAGAWHELGRYCVPAEPGQTHKLAQAIAEALHMLTGERRIRMRQLKDKVLNNRLDLWFSKFQSAAVPLETIRRSAS